MQKLRIQNFGPIKDGFTDSKDGFFVISKLTLFVGDQGTGKSTIAKIISLFSWLEKQYQNQEATFFSFTKSDFEERFLSFHRIDTFLSTDTKIEYISNTCTILYENDKLEIKYLNKLYIRPKVLYIPAERSYCTAISNPNKVSGISTNVLSFLSDYYDAAKAQKGNKVLLPLNGYEFRFSEFENTAYISDKKNNYEIIIEQASSGLQSITPLYITINYFLNKLSLPINKRYNELSLFQLDELNSLNEKNDIHGNLFKAEIEKIVNSRLVCIIEEPEQSLFPTSQYELIMNILKGFSNKTNNSLVITTHSPYILETINNCIYANSIKESGKDIQNLIPIDSLISFENVNAYKIENGKIHSIMDTEIKQIDSGAIDACSTIINDTYTKLTDIDFGD